MKTYELKDVSSPNLLEDIFPYTLPPLITFEGKIHELIDGMVVEFDPQEVPYEKILNIYWHNINPTQVNGQFVDEGSQYRTVIFYHNEEQKQLAEKSKQNLMASGRYNKPIVTQIIQASEFYPAENYHQEYYQKNPLQYNLYHNGSGRDEYLKKTWGKDTP